jgi:hypothetical protein
VQDLFSIISVLASGAFLLLFFLIKSNMSAEVTRGTEDGVRVRLLDRRG